MKTESPEGLWVVVTEERSDGYFHLRARITTRRYDKGELWPYGTEDRYKGPLYSGLTASCQGDYSSQLAQARECAVYGFGGLEYRDVYSVDAATAERMAKTIRTIDRGLRKLHDTRGYARTYGEFIGRLAEVLKCKGIGMHRSKARAAMAGTAYEWLSVGDGVTAANNAIHFWQREREAMSA